MKPYIAIDVDDTIADFVGGVVERYGPPMYPDKTRLEEMYPYLYTQDILEDEQMHLDLLPIEWAVWGTGLLASRYGIIYVSARPVMLRRATEQWLSAHCFPAAEVIVAGKGKTEVIPKLNVALLVDDMPRYTEAARAAGIPTILFARRWNTDTSADWRAEDWLEVACLTLQALG